jgi:hypothetical protein
MPLRLTSRSPHADHSPTIKPPNRKPDGTAIRWIWCDPSPSPPEEKPVYASEGAIWQPNKRRRGPLAAALHLSGRCVETGFQVAFRTGKRAFSADDEASSLPPGILFVAIKHYDRRERTLPMMTGVSWLATRHAVGWHQGPSTDAGADYGLNHTLRTGGNRRHSGAALSRESRAGANNRLKNGNVVWSYAQ